MSNYVEQVGGDHYQAKYQHWDWAAETGLGGLEWNATKYLGRFRKKGGKKDLEKALSYIKKLIAVNYDGRVTPYPPLIPAGLRPGRSSDRLNHYIISAELDEPESDLTVMIDYWKTDNDLRKIVEDLEALINATGD